MAYANAFNKEVVVELPTSDRWLNTCARTARVFAKGPSGGANADTGICLLLHGIGGKQNDISWKIMRKRVADQHNMVVVGVNYFGTNVMGAQAALVHRAVKSKTGAC